MPLEAIWTFAIDLDAVFARAILADVGKLLECEIGPDGKCRQSAAGQTLRHPFTGMALALECGIAQAICHIIATHAAEGDLVRHTTDAYILHHADFMAFDPFRGVKPWLPASDHSVSTRNAKSPPLVRQLDD